MVLLDPPAPAARVDEGRALATLSARSAAAFLLMAVAGPPGAFGDEGRPVPVEEPEAAALLPFTGDAGRGEDLIPVSACPFAVWLRKFVGQWYRS